jgi:hypothetical protein
MADRTTEPNDEVKDSWQRGWAVFNELVVHTLVIIFVVLCIEAIELVISFTRHGEEIIFFKDSPFMFPARWLFDAADIAMISSLLFRGVVSAYLIYKGTRR